MELAQKSVLSRRFWEQMDNRHGTRIFRALKCLCTMLCWWDIWLHILSKTQVDSAKSRLNENVVLWGDCTGPYGSTNSSKGTALAAGG